MHYSLFRIIRASVNLRAPLGLALLSLTLLSLGSLSGCLTAADEEVLEHLNSLGESKGLAFPDREDYYGVFVLDENNAWAVGNRGLILHITDKGQNFTQLPSGVERAIYDVDFADAENGVAIGQDGLILKTNDGGKSWKQIPLELPLEDWQAAQPHIFALSRGASPNHIWAVGPVGAVIHSVDGGETWENQSLGRDVTLNGVSFASDTEGWIAGEFGSILRTVDGGRTWQEQKNVLNLPQYTRPELSEEDAIEQRVPRLYLEDLFLIDVAFRSPTEGYVTGESGILLHTADAGETWTRILSGSFNTLLSVLPAKDGQGDLATGILGTLARKENGNWQLLQDVRTQVLTWIRDASIGGDGSFGLACGGKGTILVTTDGGKEWKRTDSERLAQISQS